MKISDKREAISLERLREALSYDPNTGEFVWRVARPGLRAGTIAGTDHIKGYRTIKVDGTFYLAHRLAWFYVTGEWPKQVDHRDTVKSNNRWANLRLATSSQNHANRGPNKNNSTGFKGVHKGHGYKRWTALICVRGEKMKLGLYDTPEEAHAAYAAAAVRYFGDFARMA